MSSFEEIRSARIKKLEIARTAFGNVYPARAHLTHRITEILKNFSQLLKNKRVIITVGRIRALRPHGGSVFFDLEDNGVQIQGFLRRDDIDKKLFEVFLEAVDIGDFVEISGKAYFTKKRERSVIVSRWRLLSKSLRPLPEKWHGLTDIEERYRKRALDLISNEETRSLFITRARLITFLRGYFDALNFIEVETPILQAIPGGTNARPFTTHHNALDTDLYLRIAPELYLKRLVVGGFNRVYEIGRNFRNEGIDVTHNPEFTMLEAYISYFDYEELMKFIETMMKKLLRTIFRKNEFSYLNQTISFTKPFKRITFFDALRQYALIPDIENLSREDLIIRAKRLGVDVAQTKNMANLLDSIFKKAVKQHCVQPVFVYDWPATLIPLAKRSEKDASIVESFQLYMGGLELVKGFSELNDPIDQRARFEEQEALREGGDEEAQHLDEDYLENLEYGLPPTAGFGLGIDRLTLLVSNTHNIRDVILFPTLRPKN